MTPTREQLEEENLRMREACKALVDRVEQEFSPEDLSSDQRKIFDLAKSALLSIPHTDRLAKQREADLKCANLLKLVQENLRELCEARMCDNRCKCWLCLLLDQINHAVAERERVYKGEI